MNLLTKLRGWFSTRIDAIKNAIDVRDVLVYGGLFFIGYGLHQLYPWLGFTAFGIVSMLLGLGWIIRVPK